MLINELSKRTGVSIHTLRYYENFGFFKGIANEEKKTNNYKNYDEGLIEKIDLIKEAKEAGFTLSEVKHLLNSWLNNKLKEEKKIEIFNSKVEEINLKIVQLKRVRTKLLNTIKDIKNGKC